MSSPLESSSAPGRSLTVTLGPGPARERAPASLPLQGSGRCSRTGQDTGEPRWPRLLSVAAGRRARIMAWTQIGVATGPPANNFRAGISRTFWAAPTPLSGRRPGSFMIVTDFPGYNGKIGHDHERQPGSALLGADSAAWAQPTAVSGGRAPEVRLLCERLRPPECGFATAPRGPPFASADQRRARRPPGCAATAPPRAGLRPPGAGLRPPGAGLRAAGAGLRAAGAG
jgi:hypothetical protein